jgi:hypothetical protein
VALLLVACGATAWIAFVLYDSGTAPVRIVQIGGKALLFVSRPEADVFMRAEVSVDDGRIGYTLNFFGRPEPEDSFEPLEWLLWLEGDAKFEALSPPELFLGDDNNTIEIVVSTFGEGEFAESTEVQVVRGTASTDEPVEYLAGPVAPGSSAEGSGLIAVSLPMFGTDSFAAVIDPLEVSGNQFYDGLPEGRWFAPDVFRIDVDLPDLGPSQSLIRSIPEPTLEGRLRWGDDVYVEPRFTISDATLASSGQRNVFFAGALVGLASGFLIEAMLSFFEGVPEWLRGRGTRQNKK